MTKRKAQKESLHAKKPKTLVVNGRGEELILKSSSLIMSIKMAEASRWEDNIRWDFQVPGGREGDSGRTADLDQAVEQTGSSRHVGLSWGTYSM